MKKQKNNRIFDRLNFLFVIIIIASIAIVFKLFNLQVVKHGYYEALASGQHSLFEELVPERGEIYVEDKFSKKLYPLAINKKMNLVYAVPEQIEDKNATSILLAPLLSMSKDEIYDLISDEKKLYVPIKHKVEGDTVEQIKNLNLSGISYQTEDWRYYPDKVLGSHILGFVGFVNDQKKGQYGVEGYYDNTLSGKNGFLQSEKNTLGEIISGTKNFVQGAEDGSDIVLTIDRLIQDKVETVVKDAVEKNGAESGSAIVMDPQTGAIIAMAGYPNFDPNNYSEVENVNVFSNSSIYELYEPGSAFKPLIVSMALDQNLISPDTKFNDNGKMEIDEYTIQNFDKKAYGDLTVTQILEKSNNIGMVQIARTLGREKMYDYMINYGFDENSGVDLDTEAGTIVKKPNEWSEMDFATMSFGQGIATTPLRLINAISCVANGGRLLKPYIVKKIIRPDGSEETTKPKAVRQVIKPETAETLSAMMVSVMEKGFGQPARVEGYKIAGKTGTAQVPSSDGKGYDPNKKITTFVGFGPIEYPRFAILVKLNNPGGDVWAESTTGPAFKAIAQELLKYYQIAPSN
ncbi:MAG: penicillin-binding protein 2 [Patescibacteria group bacterium]|nr:penicillin-binding protein 2 [Patescibacteria group bacterium]